jgi:hypothetical protein
MEQAVAKRESAPEILEQSEVLRRLRVGVKEVYEIDLRGMKIPVRVLSNSEFMEIRGYAKKNVATRGGDKLDEDVETERLTLQYASTVPKGSAPLLGEKVLRDLAVDELNYLYNEYMTVLDRVNPSLESIQPEEFRLIVDALKKNVITARDCSLRQLRAICTAYVDLIQRQDS